MQTCKKCGRSDAETKFHVMTCGQRPYCADCANAKARKTSTARRRLIDGIKNVPCLDCRQVFPPECMDFDHVRGSKKSFNVSQQSSRSWVRILEEIAKCDIVCANCHRIRTKAQRKP